MRQILRFSVLLVVLFGILSTSIAQETITPQDAAKYIGETKTVCGTVASTHFATRSKGQPTFINLDKPYPNQIFTVLIWGSDRGKFEKPPEMLYSGKEICVTGIDTELSGKARDHSEGARADKAKVTFLMKELIGLMAKFKESDS